MAKFDKQGIENAGRDLETLSRFVNGEDSDTANPRKGRNYPTIPYLVEEIQREARDERDKVKNVKESAEGYLEDIKEHWNEDYETVAFGGTLITKDKDKGLDDTDDGDIFIVAEDDEMAIYENDDGDAKRLWQSLYMQDFMYEQGDELEFEDEDSE